MDAKRALSTRTVAKRRETLGWIALSGCALLLLVGVVVYFQSKADTGPPPTHSSAPAETSDPVKP